MSVSTDHASRDNWNRLTCADFQSQLPEIIASGQSLAQHPHLRTCVLCRALLADLETIADTARRLFPIEDPPESLWEHIESAIRKEEAASFQ